jgi:peptidoglycan hydrolase-like protein with peptidoglycan-binding domain
MAPTADRIKEIQAALVKSGHYSGEPTGKWDAASAAALKRFQEENDLKASGKLNALTLQKLGLGSETAGAAPPRKAVAAAEAGSGQ